MHPDTFEYHKPTDEQTKAMSNCREAFRLCADVVLRNLPDGPDKTHTLRVLRDAGMWANVAITRQPDGAPRT